MMMARGSHDHRPIMVKARVRVEEIHDEDGASVAAAMAGFFTIQQQLLLLLP